MVHSIGRTAMAQVQSLLCGFLQEGVLPFSSVLTVQDIVDLISQTAIPADGLIVNGLLALWPSIGLYDRSSHHPIMYDSSCMKA